MEIQIHVGKTYLTQGFINIGIKYSKLFGEHNSQIVAKLIGKSVLIKGYINRTANTNNSPRIMLGSEFTNWMHNNFKIGEILNIKIINFNKIELSKNELEIPTNINKNDEKFNELLEPLKNKKSKKSTKLYQSKFNNINLEMKNFIKIKHQFINSNFYIPSWEVRYLFIGTFNPSNGENVPYFYGRDKNQTWKLLTKIFRTDLNPNSITFIEKIQQLGIACMDIIVEVEVPESEVEYIIGKGYSDHKIINGRVIREYNTNNILKIIKKNPDLKIFSTWGKGQNLKEWKNEVSKIHNLINLVSPSLAAKIPIGENKFEYMYSDWENKIGDI